MKTSRFVSIFMVLMLMLTVGATASPAAAAVQHTATSLAAVQLGGDRLVAMQNTDGGWDWKEDEVPTTASPLNIIGPIAMGLSKAYAFDGGADYLAALEKAGDLLLTKRTNFSPSDGYLAAELDKVFGGTIFCDFMNAYFYGPLANGTYDRKGQNVLYDTEGLVTLIRNNRSGSQANMAAWDVGMGLVGAASCGADTTAWIDGVKAEINELDSINYYDVIGLAGAVYGLSFVGEAFDPTAGTHSAANSVADLADILASYQINNGGFTWNASYLTEGNEALQESMYAILALNEVNRENYLSQIHGAADYLISQQDTLGGWKDFDKGILYEWPELTGEALWAISEAYPELWVCNAGDCGHPGASYNTIQGAVNAIPVYGTIHVAAGTYNEAVNITKPLTLEGSPSFGSKVVGQLTINASNVNVTGLDLSNPGGNYGIYVVPAKSDILITGNQIHNIGGTNFGSWAKGIYFPFGTDQVTIDGNKLFDIHSASQSAQGINTGDSTSTYSNADITIRNNEFSNISSTAKGGYGVCLNNGAGSTGVVIQGNQFSTISGKWVHAIGLESDTPNAVVEGNVFNSLSATDPNATIPDESAVFFEANLSTGTVKIEKNQFLSDGSFGVAIHPALTGVSANASINWWGSILGPAAGSIGGNITSSPWCADATCTTTAPDANNEIFLSGNYNQPGGFEIYTPGLTVHLAPGTVIKNSSPCFIINASNTTIISDTIGGAKCVPTNNSNGIDVNAGLVNVVIDGLEIDGSDASNTATGTGDGIHFAGAVTDVLLDNNNIHNMKGDGIEFTDTPAGFVEIQGNLIRDNGGYGVKSIDAVNADYNSWGTYAVPANAANFTVNNNTHVALSLVSSGTPWANQVVSNKEITYAVKADLKNATGADFTLEYPSFLTLGTVTMGNYFTSPAYLNKPVIDTTQSGVIHFAGYSQSGSVSQENATLFTVTFTANGTGTGALNFVDSSAEFAMSPASGASNNIYPAALADATVKAIALPKITASGVEGYYLTGEQREFTMTVTNTNGGNYSNVIFNYTITGASESDITSFEFLKGTDWVSMDNGTDGEYHQDGTNVVGTWGLASSGGFPMGPDFTSTYHFRVNFKTAKDYDFNIKLVDLNSTPANFVLDDYSNTARVYDAPTISSADLQGPYLTGVQRGFSITASNPATGGTFGHVIFNYTITGASLTDIASFEFNKGGIWTPMNAAGEGTLIESGGNLVGTWGLAPNGFPMSAPFNSEYQFRITFNTGKVYPITINLVDVDSGNRLLATFVSEAKVYANYTVTGTFSMQGRGQRAGLPVMLTATSVPFGPYSGTTINALSSNITFNNVVADTYTITTNQPRYLNITADLNKTFNLTANKALAALELKGGNAIWSDNAINISDASRVSSVYGQTIANDDGDVNFDGKITIADLALVGGNYGLTSSAAYLTWQP